MTLSSYVSPDRRAVTDMNGKTRTLRTIFVPFEAKGVLYAWGPVQPANGPPTRTTSG